MQPTPLVGSYRVMHCLDGHATLQGPANEVALERGETVLVPGCAEAGLTIRANQDTTLLDDCVPDMKAFRSFLTSQGVPEEACKALSQPPRAV